MGDAQRERVLHLLTEGGREPVDYRVLFGGYVCGWDPGDRVFFMVDVKEELRAACEGFLREMRWVCDSQAALNAHAAAHSWPNWIPNTSLDA